MYNKATNHTKGEIIKIRNYLGLSRGTAEESEYAAVLRVCRMRKSVPPLRSGSTGLRPKQLPKFLDCEYMYFPFKQKKTLSRN